MHLINFPGASTMRPAPWELLEIIEVIKTLSLSSRYFCRTFLIQSVPWEVDLGVEIRV